MKKVSWVLEFYIRLKNLNMLENLEISDQIKRVGENFPPHKVLPSFTLIYDWVLIMVLCQM